MFARLVWKLLSASRGRLSVAIVALVAGAAVISALLNLDLDVQHKLIEEFRAYGANVVLAPAKDSTGPDFASAPVTMLDGAVIYWIEHPPIDNVLAGAAPFLYVVAHDGKKQVVVAGTWLDQAQKLFPAWKMDGNWVAARSDDAHCLVGRNVAGQFGLAPGSSLDLNYEGRTARFAVSGVIDSGATEDNQIFASLSAVQTLAATPGRISLAEFAVTGTPATISDFTERLAKIFGGDVHAVRQITDAEGALLHRIQLLIFSMVVLILVLTVLCVLATMAALAMERRQDVGLMKAIGGSISRVVGIFLAEVSILGAAGGLLGCIAGVALSHWMGRRVFGAAIGARWEIFPLTVAMMVLVALAGALPLRLLGKVKPAVIFRGE